MTPTTQPIVVVAEDDRELRTLLVMALGRDGYDVVELEDGDALLEFVNFVGGFGHPAGLPALILTDVRMPGCSGLHLMSVARARGVKCPIVILTGFADATLQKMADQFGDTTVLRKPQPLEVIRSVVRERIHA
jgi:CheY-like chemotaxis protein